MNFKREIARINWISENPPSPPMQALNPVERFEVGEVGAPVGYAFVFGQITPENVHHYQEFGRKLRGIRGGYPTVPVAGTPSAPLPQSAG